MGSITLSLCIRTQAEQPELEDQIDRLLSTQAAVMTVRGTVRDDFDQNMNMSRT